MKDLKSEIVMSYEKLIEDCKLSIAKEIEVEKNKMLLEEYDRILNEVKKKPEKSYERVAKEIEKASKSSYVNVSQILTDIQ